MFSRKYVFKGSVFRCYVSLPEGMRKQKLCNIQLDSSCFVPVAESDFCNVSNLLFVGDSTLR